MNAISFEADWVKSYFVELWNPGEIFSKFQGTTPNDT
jgi:hypothetical protein